jgi:hypothetical protein
VKLATPMPAKLPGGASVQVDALIWPVADEKRPAAQRVKLAAATGHHAPVGQVRHASADV